MTRTDRRTLARQLRAEGLSQRAIARRLGVGKDTVRRDLGQDPPSAGPDDAPPGEPDTAAAPPVSAVEAEETAPDDAPQDAPSAETVADVAADTVVPRAPVARLPRRMADTELTIDLRQWPGLRRDLAVLAETGVSAEALINQAVVVLTHGYKQGVRCGVIRPDRPFVVRDLVVGPPRDFPRRPAPARDAASGPDTS